MALTLAVDLDGLTSEEAQKIAGFIVAYAEDAFGKLTIEEAKLPLNPAAVFALEPPRISEQAPSLSIGVTGTIAPTPTAPVSAGASPLDKAGLPWDARIHASSKGVNTDGTWRLKRGVDKITVEQVTAELRALMQIPSPGPQLVPAPPPPATAPPPPPLANSEELRKSYIDLFGRVSAAMSAGKLTEDQLNKCLASLPTPVPNLPLLGARLDLVPQAIALIDGIIAGQSA